MLPFDNPSGPSGHLPLHRGGFDWMQTLSI